jgi:hypothetical protein
MKTHKENVKEKDLKGLYDSIEDVKDKTTRWVLYIQFLQLYFPKCYEAIKLGGKQG